MMKAMTTTSWLMAMIICSATIRQGYSFSSYSTMLPRQTRQLHQPLSFYRPRVAAAEFQVPFEPHVLHTALHGSKDDYVFETSIEQEHQAAQPPILRKASTDPTPAVVSWWQENNHIKPGVLVASLALSLMLLSSSPMSSWAAMSGGRMGGSFSAPSRSSYSAPSRSYSAPSRSSFPAPSSYGRGFSSGFSSGYGSGYLSRPSVTISPFYNPLYSPIAPQPYFFGGPGVVTYSRGPSFFDFLLIGGLIFAVTTFIRNAQQSSAVDENGFFTKWSNTETSILGSGISVAQLSVALEVPNRDDPNSILSVLNRLATTARTDSRVGLSNLTSQVALELLRRKSSIVSASSKYQHFNDRNKAQREFQSVAIKERGKFESETVSQYGGVDYASKNSNRLVGAGSSTATLQTSTMAVVTLLLAIDGDSTKLAPIRSMADVEEALRKIAADAKVSDCLQSSEILWTPEDRSETLTIREVVADYPELRSI